MPLLRKQSRLRKTLSPGSEERGETEPIANLKLDARITEQAVRQSRSPERYSQCDGLITHPLESVSRYGGYV